MAQEKPKAAVVKGVVAVLTDEDGHAIANVADFDRSGYGGFTLKEAQRIRVKERIAAAMVRAYCSDRIARVIDRYEAGEMMNKLITSHGYHLSIIEIGHEEA